MFKKIKDYENYTINEEGTIMNKNGQEKKPFIHPTGYKIIDLYKDGKRKHFKLHRLIAETFIPNPNNYEIVDHIDRNRLNNDIINLRWATPSENSYNRPHMGGGIQYEKKISGNKTYYYYRLRWSYKYVNYSKRFKTLEEAETFRKKLMEEINKN